MVEPPGLFLGRGQHPLAGRWKRRVEPEDVTLNLSADAPVPPAPDGRRWRAVVHNSTAPWTAMWQDALTGTVKYVFLAPSARVHMEEVMRKFDAARELAPRLPAIRQAYERDLIDPEARVRQRATALWLIDRLALRIGDEKAEPDADTVGCCSLRVAHVKLRAPSALTLDFVGKDSLRYFNTLNIDARVWSHLAALVAGKQGADPLFDALDSVGLAAYMRTLHAGLTPSLLRKCNASLAVQRALDAIDLSAQKSSVDLLILCFNKANADAARACNLTRSVPADRTTDARAPGADAGGADSRTTEVGTSGRQECTRVLRSGRVVRYEVVDEEAQCGEEQRVPASDGAPKRKIGTDEAEASERVSLGIVTTAKVNYIDPRITVAFCKRSGLPLEKVWPKSLMMKMEWAMDVDENWRFVPPVREASLVSP